MLASDLRRAMDLDLEVDGAVVLVEEALLIALPLELDETEKLLVAPGGVPAFRVALASDPRRTSLYLAR